MSTLLIIQLYDIEYFIINYKKFVRNYLWSIILMKTSRKQWKWYERYTYNYNSMVQACLFSVHFYDLILNNSELQINKIKYQSKTWRCPVNGEHFIINFFMIWDKISEQKWRMYALIKKKKKEANKFDVKDSVTSYLGNNKKGM